MGKRLPYTPNSRIRSVLRQLWLRSRERAAALKSTGYCCSRCGIKQSVAKGREVKLDVHHRDGIDWDGVFQFIRDRVLQDPSRLEPLCEECHDTETANPADQQLTSDEKRRRARQYRAEKGAS